MNALTYAFKTLLKPLMEQILIQRTKLKALFVFVEGHLWKAQWKEKPNDEGHKKLTMNS